jgi:ATP-dependent phosphofructokinase / diphosphate-dependent phosphofructokinase
MARKRIGMLTGGGDVPGLNSVIKSVVFRATESDREIVGIRRGWEGLTNLNMDDLASQQHYVLPLNRANTRTIDRYGGTILHSSRTNPLQMRKLPDFLKNNCPQQGGSWDLTQQVLTNLERLRLDYLVAIGGDDTLSYAAHLDSLGVKVVAIPKTMDNDVRNTEYCIGFSTAITRAMDAIQRQRTTIGSHERVGIFRIFGRDAGFTALYTAYVTNIRCCIPEYKVSLEKLIDLLMTEKRSTPSNYVLVVLSEGAQWEGYTVQEYGDPDAFGHRHKASIGEALAMEIHKRTGEECIVSDLTYDLRSGEPDFADKLIAATFGNIAMDAVLDGQSGVMAALVHGCYTLAPMPDPKLGHRMVDVDTMYNKERYRPNYAHKIGLPVFLTKA